MLRARGAGPRPLLIALPAFVVISPVLWSGWVADDALYSPLNGVLGADRMTLWQTMAHSFAIWFLGNGRFYPLLVVEKYLVFAVFTNLLAYKILLVAATLAALELFRRFVTAYAGERFAGVAALAAAALFLVHGYQDALIAYNAMPQMVAAELFASLIAFRAYLERGAIAMAWLAAALYCAAAITYEDVYLLCLLYPVLAYGVTGSARLAVRAALPQVAIAAALGSLELWSHLRANLPPGALYAVHVGPAVFSTAWYQVIAPLPLIYWASGPPPIAAGAGLAETIAIPVVFAAFFGVSSAALGAQTRDATRPNLWVAGALLAVLPALPLAFLVKYQAELRFGLGYLPSFFQTFGLAVLAAAAAQTLSRRFGSRIALPAGVLFGLLAAAAFATNIALVKADQPERRARSAFEHQLQSGLVARVGDGSTVTIPKLFDWIAYDDSGPDGISTRGLLYAYGGRRADLEAPGNPRASFALSYDARENAWLLRATGIVLHTEKAPCNVSSIVNGDFTEGLRCWASVPIDAARVSAESACFPQPAAGTPFAEILAGGPQRYLAQAFVYHGTPERIRLRAWSDAAVSVSVGIVFPVGTGIGSERIIGTFVPPQISDSGTCTGRRPAVKEFSFSGFARGERIQLRLHAAAAPGVVARAAFNGISSYP